MGEIENVCGSLENVNSTAHWVVFSMNIFIKKDNILCLRKLLLSVLGLYLVKHLIINFEINQQKHWTISSSENKWSIIHSHKISYP